MWLDEFYRDFPEYISRQTLPAVHGLAEAVAPIAADEVASKTIPDISGFVSEYNRDLAIRYTGSSKGQITQILAEASKAGQDAAPLISARLDGWEATRSERIAANETVRLSNGTAKMVFIAAGIRRLIWQAEGSESCEFCQALDGQVVGIESKFNSLGLNNSEGHPPIHEGCTCRIAPA